MKRRGERNKDRWEGKYADVRHSYENLCHLYSKKKKSKKNSQETFLLKLKTQNNMIVKEMFKKIQSYKIYISVDR